MLLATSCLKQHVAGNKQHVAGQHVACCRQHVARPRNMLPNNMLPWCKQGFTTAYARLRSITPKMYLKLLINGNIDFLIQLMRFFSRQRMLFFYVFHLKILNFTGINIITIMTSPNFTSAVSKCCVVIGWLFINVVDLSKTCCSQTPWNGFAVAGKRRHGFVRIWHVLDMS